MERPAGDCKHIAADGATIAARNRDAAPGRDKGRAGRPLSGSRWASNAFAEPAASAQVRLEHASLFQRWRALNMLLCFSAGAP
jgi:hypothetical protein